MRRRAVRLAVCPKGRCACHVESSHSGISKPGHSNNIGPAAGAAPGLSGLIAEADALHAALGDARARAAKLAGALRRYRRRERLVASTLASLRELKLAEAAGP
jgi:hypothetical protein